MASVVFTLKYVYSILQKHENSNFLFSFWYHKIHFAWQLFLTFDKFTIKHFHLKACLSPILAKNLIPKLTHWDLTLKLMVGSIWGHSVTSQWTHKMTHTVSLLWASREFATHTASLLWAIREITRWAHHAVVAVSSLWELQSPGKFTESS